MMACLVMAIIPIIIFYLICQKYIVKGVMAGAVKLIFDQPLGNSAVRCSQAQPERLCREGNVEPARSAVLNCRAEGGAVKG